MERSFQVALVLVSMVVATLAANFQNPPGSYLPLADKTDFQFDDIWDPAYRLKSFNGRWFGDVLVYANSNGDVVARDMANNETERSLITAADMAQHGAGLYFVSPDLTEILLASGWKQVWRHSYTAVYQVFNINTKAVTPVVGANVRLQYCRWAPKGGSLTYVHGNNLYYMSSSSAAGKQLTTDGEVGNLFNGIPDWLYEEDVLSTNVAHYWSLDNRYIIYAKFNDTLVPRQKFKMYGAISDVYGQIEEIAYPKAGDITADDQPGENSKASLHLVDSRGTNNYASVHIAPPFSLASQDHYYTRVAWLSNNHVLITWTNRVQNESVVQVCHVTMTNADCYDHFPYSVSNGWIDSPWPRPVPVEDDGSRYVTIHPKPEGTSGAWRHLAIMDVKDKQTSEPTFLTDGSGEEVLSIVAYDSEMKDVYYLSTGGSAINRHLYRVNVENGTSSCITCDLGNGCQYVSAYMSSSASWYSLACMGPDVPTYSVRSTRDSSVRVMVDNKEFKANLEKRNVPTREFMKVSVGNYKTDAEVFKPPNFDPKKKYPLLVFVYAGPGSQRVTRRFPMGGTQSNWLTFLKSHHNVVVASVDGRGAASRGDTYRYEMYRRLGTVEVDDQISVTKYLKDNLGYINTTKDAAIFGWSYGGQTSSHVLAEAGDVIKCAIAVAPVTTKKYYDTAYTERYMGFATKSDNEAGYNATEVLTKAEKFKGKKYLLAHGTADDNVHFMHAAHMINELVKQEVQFKQLMYVDENHSIGTRTHSRHLFRAMTDFLVDDCWALHQDAPGTPSSGSPSRHAFNLVPALLTSLLVYIFKNLQS